MTKLLSLSFFFFGVTFLKRQSMVLGSQMIMRHTSINATNGSLNNTFDFREELFVLQFLQEESDFKWMVNWLKSLTT
jgi:hypothetical protein